MDASIAKALASKENQIQRLLKETFGLIKSKANLGHKTATLPKISQELIGLIIQELNKNGYSTFVGKNWLTNRGRLIVSW